MTCDGADVRRTEQEHLIDATMLRGFARAALNLDAVQDEVNELLFEHVARGRFHPSVVAGSLRPIIDDLLNTMTRADWQIAADELISDAREGLSVPAPPPRGDKRPRSTKPDGSAGGGR